MYTEEEKEQAVEKHLSDNLPWADESEVSWAWKAGAKWATEQLTKPSKPREDGSIRWNTVAKALNPTKEDYEH